MKLSTFWRCMISKTTEFIGTTLTPFCQFHFNMRDLKCHGKCRQQDLTNELTISVSNT